MVESRLRELLESADTSVVDPTSSGLFESMNAPPVDLDSCRLLEPTGFLVVELRLRELLESAVASVDESVDVLLVESISVSFLDLNFLPMD